MERILITCEKITSLSQLKNWSMRLLLFSSNRIAIGINDSTMIEEVAICYI